MKKLLLALACALLNQFAFAQSIDRSYASNGTFSPRMGNAYYEVSEDCGVYLPDGSAIFTGDYLSSAGIRPDGQFLMKFLPNGKLDPSFGQNGVILHNFQHYDNERFSHVKAMGLMPDGKIIVAINYAIDQSKYRLNKRPQTLACLARFMPNGDLDLSFGQNGLFALPEDAEYTSEDIKALSNGNAVAAFTYSKGSDTDIKVYCFNPNGQLQSDWSNNGVLHYDYPYTDPSGYNRDHQESFPRLIALPNNELLVTARFSHPDKSERENNIIKIKNNGSLDQSFGSHGAKTIRLPITNYGFGGTFSAVQPDGKILLSGYVDINNDFKNCKYLLARLDINGNFDPSFGNNGVSIAPTTSKYHAGDAQVQADGKIIAILSKLSGGYTLARFTKDGKKDTSFGNNGESEMLGGTNEGYGIFWGNKGKIYVWGIAGNEQTNMTMTRFNVSGSERPTPSPSPSPSPNPIPNPTPVPTPTPTNYETLRTFLHTETTARNFKMNLKYTQPIDASISIHITNPSGQVIKQHKTNVWQEADDYEEIFTLPRTTAAGTYTIHITSEKINTKVQLVISAEKRLNK